MIFENEINEKTTPAKLDFISIFSADKARRNRDCSKGRISIQFIFGLIIL